VTHIVEVQSTSVADIAFLHEVNVSVQHCSTSVLSLGRNNVPVDIDLLLFWCEVIGPDSGKEHQWGLTKSISGVSQRSISGVSQRSISGASQRRPWIDWIDIHPGLTGLTGLIYIDCILREKQQFIVLLQTYMITHAYDEKERKKKFTSVPAA
jgi:hypothetical protein